MVSVAETEGKSPPHRSTATTTSSSRCWMPLVYSSLAVVLDQRFPEDRRAGPDGDSDGQSDGNNGEGPLPSSTLFPFHSWVLAATVLELLLLDGTLHASDTAPTTMGGGAAVAVRPDSQVSLLLLEPDNGRNDAFSESQQQRSSYTDGSDSAEDEVPFCGPAAAPRKVIMARHKWHAMGRDDRASFALLPSWLAAAATAAAASDRRDKSPLPSMRGVLSPSSTSVFPPPPLERRKKRKRSEYEREPVPRAATGDSGSILVDTADAERILAATTEERNHEVPAAQDVVTSILDRVTSFTREHPLDFGQHHHHHIVASREPTPPRRKVSDSSDSAKDECDDDRGCGGLAWFSPESVEPTTRSRLCDIAVHWNQVKQGLASKTCVARGERVVPPSASLPPQFLEASISTEGVLRRYAHEVTKILVETFETRHLRQFFGYRKSSTPTSEDGAREGLISLLKDFLFDASHAMFAWQDFEMANRDIRQNDESIAAALFDDRTLRQIGGMETGSIMRLALALGRSRGSNRSWTGVFATDEGKALVRHHLRSRDDLLGIGEMRRGRRMRQRQPLVPLTAPVEFTAMSPPTWPGQSTVSSSGTSATACGPRSRASSIASLDDDPALPLFDASGRIQVRMARKSHRWGVKLSRIGDMCVVESCEALALNLVAGVTQSDHLERGDQVLLVANHRGERAHSPAYRSLPRGANWFAAMVNMFASSSQVTLLVQRVAPATMPKSA